MLFSIKKRYNDEFEIKAVKKNVGEKKIYLHIDVIVFVHL